MISKMRFLLILSQEVKSVQVVYTQKKGHKETEKVPFSHGGREQKLVQNLHRRKGKKKKE